MNKLFALCGKKYEQETWSGESHDAFDELFSTRYSQKAKADIQFRTPDMKGDENIPFSALIHSSNPKSGAYGGMSFVLFPIKDGNVMVSLVVGTQGLSPDENILGKPGHSRKINAITRWLNTKHSNNGIVSWSKQDPTRIDINVPETIRKEFSIYESVFKRYGKVLYAFTVGTGEIIHDAVTAYLDLFFEERGYYPRANFENSFNQIKTDYLQYILPSLDKGRIIKLLSERKYLIIQGPPGTGKTRISQDILINDYGGRGKTIQFHANSTYETFIGGLFPQKAENQLGFTFSVRSGDLIKATVEAQKTDKPYLFIIDEINRADLSKVLGEAIYCLEPFEDRQVSLPFESEELKSNVLRIPQNLHILGTMNTSDRSISSIDVAIRRRFAFVDAWPDLNVIQTLGREENVELFKDLLSIFIEYANEESFNLFPGHSYFIPPNEVNSNEYLKTNLLPLLRDYINQGYISSYADQIEAFIQKVESLQ